MQLNLKLFAQRLHYLITRAWQHIAIDVSGPLIHIWILEKSNDDLLTTLTTNSRMIY